LQIATAENRKSLERGRVRYGARYYYTSAGQDFSFGYLHFGGDDSGRRWNPKSRQFVETY
jgi:hypothetical protein